MDIKGFRKVTETLKQAGVDARVTPEPTVDRPDVAYATIDTGPTTSHASTLNALARAGLVAETAGQRAAAEDRGDWQDASFVHGPKLEPVLSHEGSITFVDTNNGY